jgi:hypothetical protein
MCPNLPFENAQAANLSSTKHLNSRSGDQVVVSHADIGELASYVAIYQASY